MKSWSKVIGIAASSLAVVVVCAAASAGTGGAQPPGVGSSPTAGPAVQASNGVGQSKHKARPSIVLPTEPPAEAVLTPIVPCRAVDTRQGGGRMANGTTRSFLLEGNGSLTSQGGAAAGCGIPSSATALAAVISAVNPTSQGYLKAYPFGATTPASSVIDYSRTITTSSGVTVAITPNTARGLTVFNFGGPTDVLIDITGYYQPQIRAYISPDGYILGGDAVSVTHGFNTGVYKVYFDQALDGCTAVVTPSHEGYFASTTSASDYVYVEIWQLSGGSTTDSEDYFDLLVSC